MTTAVLDGIRSGLGDDFGSVIPDTRHLALFRFVGEATGVRDDDGWAHATRDELQQLIDRLALAARSTASFPAAFEPSLVPWATSVAGRPAMKDYLQEQLGGARYAVDGGTLLNKRFDPAIKDIYSQPAEAQVRRVLLYVCPDPGEPPGHKADNSAADRTGAENPPGIALTVLASLVTMPRTESVADELLSANASSMASSG